MRYVLEIKIFLLHILLLKFSIYVSRCVGEVKRLAAGGGHSAVLTDAHTLKELCEFRLAESVNLSNCIAIADIASRTSADSLARLCERYRYCYFQMKPSFLLRIITTWEIMVVHVALRL